MTVELLPAPAPADGTKFDWGIVASPDPLTVRINGAGVAVNVANRTREASFVAAGDKVLLMRTGYGGYTYVDRIVDVVQRAAPDEPITSLQPTPSDPAPGEPGAPTPPVDPDTGQPPVFLPLAAPTNVLIADILWNTFTVTYDYTRDTGPNRPVETGFQVNIIRTATNEVVQTEYVSSATRSVRVGSLVGSVFYRAEVRAITTAADAFATYTEAQVRNVLSGAQRQISSLYSRWARSPQVQSDDPPVSGVVPPINVRWGSVLRDSAVIEWDYQPAPTVLPPAVATSFQIRMCQNSIGTRGCQIASVGPTVRKHRMTALDSSQRYWGFVRTQAGTRFSHWVPIGPPRRTHQDFRPQIRNFTVRRAGPTSPDIIWSAEIRNATEFRYQLNYRLTAAHNGSEVLIGSPLDIFFGWYDIIGGEDRQGWATVGFQEPNWYAGRATITITLVARNRNTETTATATLDVRGLAQFLGQRLAVLGNRGAQAILSLVGFIPFGRGFGPAAQRLGTTLFDNILRGSYNRVASELVAGRRILGTAAAIRFAPAVVGQTLREYTIPRLGQYFSGRVGRIAIYRTAAQAQSIAGPVNIFELDYLFITQYLGWETIEWEIGAAFLGDTYSRDFAGSLNRPPNPQPGASLTVRRTITNELLTQIININYFAPNATIRVRTRATNEAGTTAWNSSFVTPNDFALVVTSD